MDRTASISRHGKGQDFPLFDSIELVKIEIETIASKPHLPTDHH